MTTLEEARCVLTVLQVRCSRCKRRSRIHLPAAIAEHGPTLSLGGLLRILAIDCPKRQAQLLDGLCGVEITAGGEFDPEIE